MTHTLDIQDPGGDPDARAARLGVSRAAVDLLLASHAIDLHIESFIWTRVWGYDLSRRHGRGLLGARLYSQVDLPRAVSSGMSGGVWSIATNPLRRRSRRTATFLRNLARLRAIIEGHPDTLALVRSRGEYLAARAAGKYACWLAVQGGNGLDTAAGDVERIPDDMVTRITLVHMTRSTLGSASTAQGHGGGLTPAGADMVARMNARRILVDLAHISRKGFWEALEVHDRSLPPMVSHTGVCGVHDCWRNLEDRQVRAVARRGGVVGVIFHSLFLDGSLLGTRVASVLDHLEHVIKVGGEEAPALGSDWDGFIVTPRDMPTVEEFPVLVQAMLERGWSEARVRRVLGENYLRMLGEIRP